MIQMIQPVSAGSGAVEVIPGPLASSSDARGGIGAQCYHNGKLHIKIGLHVWWQVDAATEFTP